MFKGCCGRGTAEPDEHSSGDDTPPTSQKDKEKRKLVHEAVQRLIVNDEAKEVYGEYKDAQRTADDGTVLHADLGYLLTGEIPDTPDPGILQRIDGQFILYMACLNYIFGKPDTGKSWIALAACEETLNRGTGLVAYIDADHNGRDVIAARLYALGVPLAVLADPLRFRYYEPDSHSRCLRIIAELAEFRDGVAVIDSVGEMVPLMGGDSDSNDALSDWNRAVSVPLVAAGWCVIALDHLSKGADGEWPTGGGAKKRFTNGTMLHVKIREPMAPGRTGSAYLNIRKDRHGKVKESHPTSAGLFTLDSRVSGMTEWAVSAPLVGGFVPTQRMQDVSEWAAAWFKDNPGSVTVTQRDIREGVGGNAKTTRHAITLLVANGYLTSTSKGTRQVRPYTVGDPLEVADDDDSEGDL
jgi:hypothetical protein